MAVEKKNHCIRTGSSCLNTFRTRSMHHPLLLFAELVVVLVLRSPSVSTSSNVAATSTTGSQSSTTSSTTTTDKCEPGEFLSSSTLLCSKCPTGSYSDVFGIVDDCIDCHPKFFRGFGANSVLALNETTTAGGTSSAAADKISDDELLFCTIVPISMLDIDDDTLVTPTPALFPSMEPSSQQPTSIVPSFFPTGTTISSPTNIPTSATTIPSFAQTEPPIHDTTDTTNISSTTDNHIDETSSWWEGIQNTFQSNTTESTNATMTTSDSNDAPDSNSNSVQRRDAFISVLPFLCLALFFLIAGSAYKGIVTGMSRYRRRQQSNDDDTVPKNIVVGLHSTMMNDDDDDSSATSSFNNAATATHVCSSSGSSSCNMDNNDWTEPVVDVLSPTNVRRGSNTTPINTTTGVAVSNTNFYSSTTTIGGSTTIMKLEIVKATMTSPPRRSIKVITTCPGAPRKKKQGIESNHEVFQLDLPPGMDLFK